MSRDVLNFGARYYDSDLSVWLSVYPLSDKYPSLSPYVYTANNPIRYIDPDGRKIVPTNSAGALNSISTINPAIEAINYLNVVYTIDDEVKRINNNEQNKE